jgi:hypothetical protein
MSDKMTPFMASPIEVSIDRRTALAAGLAMGAFPQMAMADSHGQGDVSLRGPTYDLTTAYGNVEAYAKVTSNLDMKSTHFGWLDGYVMGVGPGGAV